MLDERESARFGFGDAPPERAAHTDYPAQLCGIQVLDALARRLRSDLRRHRHPKRPVASAHMQTLEQVAYDASCRALTHQEAFMAGIQQRTGTFLSKSFARSRRT
jgi:hypothetical protein